MKIEIEVEPLFEFHSFSNWVSTAQRKYAPYKYTPTITLNNENKVCQIGEDFQHTRDNDLFPVTVYRMKRSIEE